MLKILDVYEDYKSHMEDYDLLRTVYRRMINNLLETTGIEELIDHNHRYRKKLISCVHENFPAIAHDISCWSAEEFKTFLKLLLEQPVFWQEDKETLVGLFWSLDIKGQLTCKNEVIQLCTHLNMVGFVADAHNSSVVAALNALIDKYATVSQAEQFQKRVDLAINEFS